ncbi:hypothetical protein DJ90_6562 [Paenibacillus macerans]|uniref:Uncharacterized protein n=1 Tax=Paenibacillus macerans TaxID=44252 RepID=A0A090ZN99_PAEMA|nr:hypothetical protein DJ90_6562 [Paenibacillus macerans]
MDIQMGDAFLLPVLFRKIVGFNDIIAHPLNPPLFDKAMLARQPCINLARTLHQP